MQQFTNLDYEIAVDNVGRISNKEKAIEITVGLDKGIKMSYINSKANP